MKRLLAALAIALTLGSSAYARDDDGTLLGRFGHWTVWRYDSKSMCVANSTNAHGTFHVKWQVGYGMFVQASKLSWRVPQSATARMEISFNTGDWIAGNANGTSTLYSIQLGIPTNDEMPLLRNFMGARRMQVRFIGGTERPWTYDLNGSESAGFALMACVRDYGGDIGVTTQPHQIEAGQ